jgi:hypothetical protein
VSYDKWDPAVWQSAGLATHKSGNNSKVKAGAAMSKNIVSFADAELAGLAIKTAKNGNSYATGVMIIRNEEGRYEASLPFICFSAAVGALRALAVVEQSADLVGESGKPERPVASVSGWFKTDKRGDNWSTIYRLESVDVIPLSEESTL